MITLKSLTLEADGIEQTLCRGTAMENVFILLLALLLRRVVCFAIRRCIRVVVRRNVRALRELPLRLHLPIDEQLIVVQLQCNITI